MFLFNSDEESKKAVKFTKDIFGNDIGLDSNGNIILKKERIAIVKDKNKMLIKETIQMDFSDETSKYATQLLNKTNTILANSPYKDYKPKKIILKLNYSVDFT